MVARYKGGMSLDTREWLMIGHIVGFVTWIAGMIATLTLLRIHAQVEGAARDVLSRQEHKTAALMDAGATLAMVCGLWLAFGGTVNALKTGAWLHLKLTLVVIVLLGAHGFARAQVKRFKRGQLRTVPQWLRPLVLIAAAVIIVLGAKKDLLRKQADPAPAAPVTTGK